MLYEISEDTIVQIEAHHIGTGTSWKVCQYTATGGGVKSERHRPARDCSDEAVVLVPNDVQHI
jgi:hypothetical protein